MCLYICRLVCVSVRLCTSKTTCPNLTKFSTILLKHRRADWDAVDSWNNADWMKRCTVMSMNENRRRRFPWKKWWVGKDNQTLCLSWEAAKVSDNKKKLKGQLQIYLEIYLLKWCAWVCMFSVVVAGVKGTTLSMQWRSLVDGGPTAHRKCNCWPCVKVIQTSCDFMRSFMMRWFRPV